MKLVRDEFYASNVLLYSELLILKYLSVTPASPTAHAILSSSLVEVMVTRHVHIAWGTVVQHED
jgi:hypothetical protein